MSWFRKKNGYWYFCKRINGKEVQWYVGNDDSIFKKLLPKKKEEELNLDGTI